MLALGLLPDRPPRGLCGCSSGAAKVLGCHSRLRPQSRLKQPALSWRAAPWAHPQGGDSLLSLLFHTHPRRTLTACRSLGTLRGPGAPCNTARSPTGAAAPAIPSACLAVQSPRRPSCSVTPPPRAEGAFSSTQNQARALGPEGSLGQEVGTLGGPGRWRCPLWR